MDQIYNSMLFMAQVPAERPAGKPAQSQESDSFQKQMEQASGKTESKPETSVQDQPQEGPVTVEDPQELEKQMALAAMAVMQNPVVPVEQVTAPEETAVTEVSGVEIVTETAEAPVVTAPETAETAEIMPEEGVEQPVEQLSQEQAKPAEAETQTAEDTGAELEVKVTTGETGGAEQETDTQDAPEEGMAEAPVFRDVREIPVKVGEAPKAPETEEPVEKQIAPKLTEALRNGETRVELQLTPENLGKVTVEMTWSKDGGLVVQLHAENRSTQELLGKNTAGLEQLLGREAQQEVRVEVPRQEESQRQDLYEQQQERHQRRQQEQRQRQQAGGEDFLQQLRLGLIPLDGE